MINENCPCKKKKCERYGNCDECRKHHAESKRQRPVACEKKKHLPRKNNVLLTFVRTVRDHHLYFVKQS